MKSPEVYTAGIVIDPDFKIVIKKIQKEAYNEALRDVKKLKVIDKESISKLKK